MFDWLKKTSSAKSSGSLKRSLSPMPLQPDRNVLESAPDSLDVLTKDLKHKSEALAHIAHDVRTLTNSILGFSNILLTTSLENRQKEYVQTIISSSRLMLHIVHNVLLHSKIQTGKLQLEKVDFHLPTLVEDIRSILSVKTVGKPLLLQVVFAPDVPTALQGDPVRLKQVLLNLMDNAIKFTTQGEIRLEVSTASPTPFSPSGVLQFVVADSGIGIPAEKIDVIFKEYQQADGSIERKYGGSGLGLSICKSYVEAMGGKIWVESRLREGSRFIFTLPVTLGAMSPQAPDDCRVAEHSASLAGIRALVVEDNETNRELMQVYFQELGCQGVCVSSGAEAIRVLKNGPFFDICFMDLEIPGLNGMATAETIRREISVQLPIIALSGAEESEEKEKCLKAGMNDFLAKPFQMEDLRAKILQFFPQRNKQIDV